MKDEITWNPRWDQNVIDKVNLTILVFIPVLAFKRRFAVGFFIFQVNRYV